MRWVQDFRMRPEAPIDTEGMTDRIDANSKIQMAVIRDKVEAAARPRSLPEPESELEPAT